MMYTGHSDCRRLIYIGVHGMYIHRVQVLSQTVHIYVIGQRTFVKVGLQHVWRPREGDDVV